MGGSAVIRALLRRFPDVTVKACRFTREPFLPPDPRLEWVQADLRNLDAARRAAAGCDAAVMAAVVTAGSKAMAAEPWRAANENVVMNTRLLEALHCERVRRVVFVGSATVYQPFDGPIAESALDMNQDPHPAHFGVGWAMRFTEKLCRFWHLKTGMETLVVRAANLFGPYAIFDPERSNVVPALIRKAVDRMDPFEIWGSPDVVRDVIYVEDFADAVVALLAAEEIQHDTFNVGRGEGATVGEIAEWACDAAGHRPRRFVTVGDAPATPSRRILDCSKIRRVLGWTPQWSVQDGIRETTRWWMENKDTWTR